MLKVAGQLPGQRASAHRLWKTKAGTAYARSTEPDPLAGLSGALNAGFAAGVIARFAGAGMAQAILTAAGAASTVLAIFSPPCRRTGSNGLMRNRRSEVRYPRGSQADPLCEGCYVLVWKLARSIAGVCLSRVMLVRASASQAGTGGGSAR
jgi:hypothetical protein